MAWSPDMGWIDYGASPQGPRGTIGKESSPSLSGPVEAAANPDDGAIRTAYEWVKTRLPKHMWDFGWRIARHIAVAKATGLINSYVDQRNDRPVWRALVHALPGLATSGGRQEARRIARSEMKYLIAGATAKVKDATEKAFTMKQRLAPRTPIRRAALAGRLRMHPVEMVGHTSGGKRHKYPSRKRRSKKKKMAMRGSSRRTSMMKRWKKPARRMTFPTRTWSKGRGRLSTYKKRSRYAYRK